MADTIPTGALRSNQTSTAPLKDRISALETELRSLKAEEKAQRHPYAFDGLYEARMALKDHACFGCGDLRDRQRQITKTLDNLAGADEVDTTALNFLVRELSDVHEKLDAWHTRNHRLAIIVGDFDLDALSKYPGTKSDAPPVAA